ncbi:MAG: hypothetical protein ACLTYW_02905 [Collinsella sp.]
MRFPLRRFEPVQTVTACVVCPGRAPSRRSLPWLVFPTPRHPRLGAAACAVGLMASLDPVAALSVVDEQGRRGRVSLDNALNNLDFTSVFAPIDPHSQS